MTKVIIQNLTSDEFEKKGIESWPIWTKDISRFDWYYDTEEECYILQGEVIVETAEGNFTIKPGDFVTFKKGLKCVWDVKKPIEKHYNFR